MAIIAMSVRPPLNGRLSPMTQWTGTPRVGNVLPAKPSFLQCSELILDLFPDKFRFEINTSRFQYWKRFFFFLCLCYNTNALPKRPRLELYNPFFKGVHIGIGRGLFLRIPIGRNLFATSQKSYIFANY